MKKTGIKPVKNRSKTGRFHAMLPRRAGTGREGPAAWVGPGVRKGGASGTRLGKKTEKKRSEKNRKKTGNFDFLPLKSAVKEKIRDLSTSLNNLGERIPTKGRGTKAPRPPL